VANTNLAQHAQQQSRQNVDIIIILYKEIHSN